MDRSSRGKFLVDLVTKPCAENKYYTRDKENAVADPIPNNNAVDIKDSNQNSESQSTVDDTNADATSNPPDHNLNSDSDCSNQTRNKENAVADLIPNNNAVDIKDSNQNSESESTFDDSDADVTWNPPDHNLNSDSDCSNQTRNKENAVADPIPNNNAVDIRDSNQNSESESTVDDTDADVTWNPPDHNLNSDSDCSNQDDVEDHEDNNTTEDEPKRCKKRKLQRDNWKRNKSKRLRNSGKEYVNVKGVVVPSRVMKPPCGVKCQFECSKKLSEESRYSIFTSFWEIGDITRQRCYIQNCMTTIQPKFRYQKSDNSRKLNNAFHFEVNSDRVRVCKLMFMNTLNIGDRFVRSVIHKNNDGIIEIDKRGKHSNHRTLDNSIKDDIRAHINKFPRIESHYLRAQTSREFIDGGLTIASMHRMYVEECNNENKQAGNITLYSKIFNEEFNIGFFVPKKDQCTLCNSFQNASEEEKQALKEDFEKHIRLKMSSRAEKEEDSKKAKNGEIILACFDLQAVLPTPCGEISVFYYKRRLSSYNFTIFNVGNQNGYCYFWNESIAHRGANETGSCIDKFLSHHSQGKEVVFFSDNCIGQNKNKFIVSMYMHAVQNYNIPSITHKFFAVGHGQNEGDSMHSVIEKQKKRILKSGPIFIPAQWVTVIQSSKKSGSPYHVTEMEMEDIKDLKELSQQIGSNFVSDENGNKVKWNELRIIRVVKEIPFSFQYKYTYDEDEPFKTVFVRRNTRGSSNLEMKSAYSSPPKISDQKRSDLISLCESNAIPKNYHNFYYNL